MPEHAAESDVSSGMAEAGHPVDYTIAAVDRAIALLEILGQIGPASLAELAREANCTRTAVFRMLRTLQLRGFAIQDGPRGSWRLGARLATLQGSSGAQGALAATTAPRLARLAGETKEAVYLLGRTGLEAEILAIHLADPKMPHYGAVGGHRPLHAGAGRLLLALAPEMVQVQVLAQPLPRLTPLTMTDRSKIAADMGRIRARGWLITESESDAGLISISAPIHAGSGEVSAAVVISGPSLRLRGNRARELQPLVSAAALDISRMLGWKDRRSPAAMPGH